MVHADDLLVGNAHAISISRRLHVHHGIRLENCQIRFSLSSYWPLARQVLGRRTQPSRAEDSTLVYRAAWSR
jgi:hypothetical protein